MELQAMAKLAASYVNTTSRHIFLTGKAGTGKTTFLKYIIDHTHKKAVVAAPTGIAAINAGGVTLHSLLQLPFGSFIPENIALEQTNDRVSIPRTLFQDFKFNASKRQLINEIELLIIDEVSMLRADLLDCIDFTLRYLRKNASPFGALQILFIGDLMQLPPVVKEHEKRLLNNYYPSLYFFYAKALENNAPIHVELNKIFRQEDQDFIDLLNRLRHNTQTREDLNFLNGYYNPDFAEAGEAGFIHLTTHNYRADKLNQQKLSDLDAPLYTFNAEIDGTFPESMFPTSEELLLKEGAQVMFIKNDPSGEGQFFNGKIGLISSLTQEEIWVQFENGSEVLVSPYVWENKRYILDKENNEIEEIYLGSFKQYPIKLAWAVTIHKSQGLTFEKAILDLSGTFAPGQLYVALSRLTSLKGLVLSSPLPENPPKIDESLARFNATQLEQKELEENLEDNQKAFVLELGQNAYDLSALHNKLKNHQKSFNKDENRSIKQKYSEWTKAILDEIQELKPIGEGFSKEIQRILGHADYLDRLAERSIKAEDYFLDKLLPIAEKIQAHASEIAKEKKVKAYRKELEDISDVLIRKIQDIERFSYLIGNLKSGADFREKFKSRLSKDLISGKLKKPPKDKTPTAEITFKLFQNGKSIKEIAAERALAESTIEGHLAEYIKTGKIPIEDLVSNAKIKKIQKVLESDAVGLAEIKSNLPKSYSYGEIKMVIAHQNRLT